MSREAPESGGTYGPGGWRSRARQKSRPEVCLAVALAARRGLRADGPAPAASGHLLEAYVEPLRGSYAANYGKDGRWWHKVAWWTPTGPVYLAVSYETCVETSVALFDLCEQIEEVKRGLRKPSPDKRRQAS